MDASLLINFAISACAFEITRRLIPSLSGMFIGANLFGNDLCKRDKPKMYICFAIKFLITAIHSNYLIIC